MQDASAGLRINVYYSAASETEDVNKLSAGFQLKYDLRGALTVG